MCVFLLLQGLVHARITFKNEASGEYTFYEVKLTSTGPAPMGCLSLECPVRNQTSATVSITNPLTVPVTLKPSISSKQVRCCVTPRACDANSFCHGPDLHAGSEPAMTASGSLEALF
jgi:hypothetical protein